MAEELTQAQQDILNRVNRRLVPIDEAVNNATQYMNRPRESGRMFAQGLTFGFGDEIEAAIRAAVPGGPEYKTVRDQIRSQLTAFKEANPSAAITAEMAGAMATMLIPGLNVARGARAVQSVPRMVGQGAVEGGVYGLGASEEETLSGMAMDAGTGAVIGAAIPTAITGVVRGGGAVGSAFTNFVRERLGVRYNDAVQAYLADLVQQSGKSLDEIVADIAEGKMISDNASVNAALKAFILEGGKPAQDLLQYVKDRARSTTQAASTEVRSALAPGMGDDVLNQFLDRTERLRRQEGNVYKDIFAQVPAVRGDIARSAEAVIRRYPDAARELQKFYSESALVPLLKVAENGEVSFVRVPSLEDVDNMYRFLRDEGNNLYAAGAGQRGKGYKDAADQIRGQIDYVYPDLAEARTNYSATMRSSEAFDEGLAALNKNVDLTSRYMRGLNEDQLSSFRAGVFSAIKDKMRRSKNTIQQLSQEDTQLGELLRLVAPEQSMDQLAGTLGIAAEARATAQAMPQRAGSQTQPLMRARERQQSLGMTAMDLRGAATGDAGSALSLGKKMVDQLLAPPSLSERDRANIVLLLTSEDPTIWRRALADDSAFAMLSQRIERMVTALAPAARGAVSQQSIEAGKGLLGL